MKKLIVILISALCVLSLAGCDLTEDLEVEGKNDSKTENGTVGTDILKPPGLTVRLGESGIEASIGSCHWTHDNGDGTFHSMHADSDPTLELKEHLPSLRLNPAGETNLVRLEFASAPDSVRVNCWSYEEESLFDVSFVGIVDESDDKVFYLDLNRDFVVEIYAEWNSSGKDSGSVYYGFCVRTAEAPALLKDGTVTGVTVSSLPNGYNYSFSGDSAKEVADYLRGLHLITDFPENPDEYVGMTWVILLEYEDNRELTVYHFGNMFVRTDEGPWYKMSYDEASRFDTLVSELE